MGIDKDLIVFAVVGFIIFIMLTSGGGGVKKKDNDLNGNNQKDDDLEKVYNKINKENRNLEGLRIKVAELENEIEVLRYEGDEDLEKADKNELKIRKLLLKTEHLHEKIFQKGAYIQDIERGINHY